MKKIYTYLVLLFTLVFVLTGCSWQKAKVGNTLVDACVYYIEENGTALKETQISLPDCSKKEKIEYLADKLINPPSGLISPLCDGTEFNYAKIEDEIAVVDFSSEFMNIKDPKYTLSAAAVAKTLCSLDFISGVNILVEGEPALGIDGTPIGIIMQSDIDDASVTNRTVVLYFGDGMGEGLIKEMRSVTVPTSSTVEKVIVDEIVKGPTGKNSISLIPAGVKVLSVETKNKVCFVNLSKDFVNKFSGGSSGEILAIYSIVNSLTELDTVGSVQFLIEGEKKDTLSHMSISEPIARDKSVIIE